MYKRFSIVWIVFFLYVAGYFTICIGTGNQELLWLELSLLSFVESVILLVKNHFPKTKYIVLSVVFTSLYLVSNIFSFNVFTLIQGVFLFLSGCASCSVFEKYERNSLRLLRNAKKIDVFVSILIGIVCGILWGGINYFLMRGSNPVVPTNILKAFIVSLNPAILEEVAFRCVFFAFCLSMSGGELKSKFQRFTGWFMMIVPHILPHMLFSIANGIIESILLWIISLVLYIFVFGFVFAFLQKKRDVVSAMIAHGIVDWLRFCFFGLPI